MSARELQKREDTVSKDPLYLVPLGLHFDPIILLYNLTLDCNLKKTEYNSRLNEEDHQGIQ